jgi:hypothetical protein
MQLTTQVAARNTKKQVVVLSSDAKGSEYVEWQPSGDPAGGDIQIVPESIANSVPFIRLLQRGIIEKMDASLEEVFDQAVLRQREAFEKRSSGAAQQALASIDDVAQNDVISMPCVGPDSRGQGRCGADVPVREQTKNDHPPLCQQHQALASQYVPSEEQEGTSSVRKWVRVTMGTPERQQQ